MAAQKAALSRREEELEKVFGRGRQVAEALLQEDRRAMLERQRQLECQLGTQIYLLSEYNSTNSDAEGAGTSSAHTRGRGLQGSAHAQTPR